MHYYEVLVGDLQFHGKSALTYSWPEELSLGSVVRIALRSRTVLGFVLRRVPEPSFSVKPIAAVAPYPPAPEQSLQLIEWLYVYYPAPFGSIIRQFLPPTTVFPKNNSTISEAAKTKPQTPEPLTIEQNAALQQIGNEGSYLLHGITGSGKTRVYQELAERCLMNGRSVIILTPEIGLTEHLVQSLSALTAPTYVLHSRLTDATRRNIWYRILNETEPCIIIGPRSALFAPVHRLGIIIMDEAHDQAYKSDSSPRYRTERVAAYLAHLHAAVLVTGSATPNIEDVYVAVKKSHPVLRMDRLARSATSTDDTKIMVDMRDTSLLTRSRILTTPLIDAVHTALDHKEQTLLFLNRRGTAAAILCSQCGWRALCTACDIPLTYHGDTHRLLCHTCGRQSLLPTACPDCNQTDILLKSIGTKAVVDEIARLFPTARVQRFDTDVEKSEQVEAQLTAMQNGECDILVGTQMIAKGLDLPKLSVVGVLNADASLMIPDFSATERTYQLIAQVVGRVGRGHRRSTVVVQTYNPTNPTLVDALQQNWQAFYERELLERQTFHYPPFTYLLKLWCLRASSSAAEKAATKLSEQIEKSHPRLKIDGPAPAFRPRESGKYRWQIIVKSPSRQALLDIIHQLPSGWQHDIDPTQLL